MMYIDDVFSLLHPVHADRGGGKSDLLSLSRRDYNFWLQHSGKEKVSGNLFLTITAWAK